MKSAGEYISFCSLFFKRTLDITNHAHVDLSFVFWGFFWRQKGQVKTFSLPPLIIAIFKTAFISIVFNPRNNTMLLKRK